MPFPLDATLEAALPRDTTFPGDAVEAMTHPDPFPFYRRLARSVRCFLTRTSASGWPAAMPSSARRWTQADEAAAALMDQGRALGLSSVQAANRIAFMQQAFDAGSGRLGHVALQLAQDPRQAAAADASREAMRALVHEVERWAAPIQNTRRFAAEPLTLLDPPIEAGQAVLLVLASATATKPSTRSPTVLMDTVKLAGARVSAPDPMSATALKLLLKW